MMKPQLLLSLAMAALLSANGSRWWADVQFLADDRLEGRDTGSEGHRKAAQYVSAEFEKAGLRPAGTTAYLQPVEFREGRIVPKESSLALVRNGAAESLQLGEDVVPRTTVNAVDVETPLVFVGYGLAVPEMQYDDFAGLDLRGKVLVMLAGGPSQIPGPLRSHYQSREERKRLFEHAGNVGVISIQNPRHMDVPWERIRRTLTQPWMKLADPELSTEGGTQFSVLLNPARAEKLFADSGHSFQELLGLADAGKPLPRFPLKGLLKARLRSQSREVESQNVAGILAGADPVLKNEYVVLSAHLDHLGAGEPVQGDRIYNGAMDNASGIATLLEVARHLQVSKAKLARSVLFLAVTGEEKGLLGSKFFAAHPTVGADRMVANLNMDMFLPLFPLRGLTVYGLKESDLGDDIRAVAQEHGVSIQDDLEPLRNIFIRSDQYSFIRRGVPSLAFKLACEKGSAEEKIARSWFKERYHAPSDDLNQPVDIEAAARFNGIVADLAKRIANRADRPKWRQESFFRRFAD